MPLLFMGNMISEQRRYMFFRTIAVNFIKTIIWQAGHCFAYFLEICFIKTKRKSAAGSNLRGNRNQTNVQPQCLKALFCCYCLMSAVECNNTIMIHYTQPLISAVIFNGFNGLCMLFTFGHRLFRITDIACIKCISFFRIKS